MSVGKSMTVVGILFAIIGIMSAPDTGGWSPPAWWLWLQFGGFLFSVGLGATIGAYDVKAGIKDGRLDPDELAAEADDVDEESTTDADDADEVDDDRDPAEKLSRNNTMHQ